MARSKNILKTIQLTISTTEPLVDQLEILVSTGLYGKNSTDAAERLIAKGIQELQREGQFLQSRGKTKGSR